MVDGVRPTPLRAFAPRMAAPQSDNGWNNRVEGELRSLLNEWDPIGISEEPDWPQDEYDDLIEPLRERLAAGATAGELAIFLERHVVDQLALDPDADREERLAERLVAWWGGR